MTAAFIGTPVATTGTTPVTVVSSPSGGKQREVISLTVVNRDSAERTVRAFFRKAAGSVNIEIGRAVLAARGGANEQLSRGQLLASGPIVLEATDEWIEVVTDATATATEPHVFPCIFEVP